MPDTVTGFRRIRDRMRGRGFVVHEVPHWEGRGAGTLRPGGKVNHHTAGSRSGGNTGSLRLVTFGREGLRNALCNWYAARNGELWIVAALTAWHAGSGGWHGISGNSRVIGLEAENDGVGEPWSSRALDAAAALDVECMREFGYPVLMIPEHKEWTSRKIDRRGIDGPAWRRRIAAESTGTGPAPTPAPIPAPAPLPQEEDMLLLKWKDQFYVWNGGRLVHIPWDHIHLISYLEKKYGVVVQDVQSRAVMLNFAGLDGHDGGVYIP
jgi:hypothetical protein